MGHISAHNAEILRNNALINLHTIEAARQASVHRYLYACSACVYPEYRQTETAVAPLREEDAYPAEPGAAHGL
jgi:nucleoside-diphosphate-sugar epimerase